MNTVLITHKLDTPPENGTFQIFIICQSLPLENFHRVDDRKTSVQLTAGRIGVEILQMSDTVPSTDLSRFIDHSRARTTQQRPWACPRHGHNW